MRITDPLRRAGDVRSAAAILTCFFLTASSGWTQVPPAGVSVGQTPDASLRNAAAATKDQAMAVQSTAQNWARRASSENYRIENFQADLRTLQLEFLGLRERFNWMESLALRSNRPYAENALAELGAGLNIIEEQFAFLNQQFSAGNLDRATLVRTCRTLQDVTGEWEQELHRSSSRMGLF